MAAVGPDQAKSQPSTPMCIPKYRNILVKPFQGMSLVLTADAETPASLGASTGMTRSCLTCTFSPSQACKQEWMGRACLGATQRGHPGTPL